MSPCKRDFDPSDGIVANFSKGQDPIFLPKQVDLDRVVQDGVPSAWVVADLRLSEPHPGDVLEKADITELSS